MGFNPIKEMSNEDKIRREERFSAISIEQRNAKRYLIQIQEERGLPVRREGKFTGIWYAGYRKERSVGWHYRSFEDPSHEFHIGYPTLVVEKPWNILCWMVKDGKPSPVLDPSLGSDI